VLDFQYLIERSQNVLEQVTIQTSALIFRQHTNQTRFSTAQWFYRDNSPDSHTAFCVIRKFWLGNMSKENEFLVRIMT
jgi:hypothetical protein